MKKWLIPLMLSSSSVLAADAEVDNYLVYNKSDDNTLSSDFGGGLGVKYDFYDFYLKASYQYGKVETLAALSDWDRWNATRIHLRDRHIFDQNANVELGHKFSSGVYAAAHLDLIHVRQYSLGFTNETDHIGYRTDYWSVAGGALVGYESNLGDLEYSVDVGFLNHFVKDIRLRAEMRYSPFFFRIKDYGDMDYTTFEIGTTWRF